MVFEGLSEAAKKIPGLRPLVIRARVAFGNLRARKRVFQRIYERNEWKGVESVSGTGSDERETREIRQHLPALWERHGIQHLVDAPCGDFRWMREIVSNLDEYTGIDIVEPLIAGNEAKYGTERIRFRAGDLILDPLPAADMILCRDCLVHLSFRQIHDAVSNMKRSGARYLLTTHFTDRNRNDDIPAGGWRPLNLTRAPFHFPQPIESIREDCIQDDGRYADKVLALWRLSDL